MNTTEKFIERVTSLLSREVVKYARSDTDRNRCKILMRDFTAVISLERRGVYSFSLYFESAFSPLRVIYNEDLEVLCEQINEYLSTLQKALEPNERNSVRS